MEENKKSVSDKSKLSEILEIENTPFVAVRQDEKWFVALGRYKISKDIESLEACKEFCNDTSWPMLIDVMSVIAQDTWREMNKQQELEEIKKFEKSMQDTTIEFDINGNHKNN